MGWDVSLYMRFNESREDIWSRYLTLVDELTCLTDTFQIDTIAGFDNSLHPGRELFTERFGPEIPEKFSAILVGANRPRLILRTDVTVVRQSWTSHVGTTSESVPTHLFLRGPEASWNPVQGAERFQLIWRVGDHKYYDRRAPKSSWEPNCNRLIHEIELLACTGHIAEIWGGQEGFDGKPENAFLVYQSDGASVPASLEAGPEQLSVSRVGDGVLIYRRDFIRGQLGA